MGIWWVYGTYDDDESYGEKRKMNFVQRMKQDKKFRAKAFFIFIIIVIIAGNSENEKKEDVARETFETCHQYNTMITGLPWTWHEYTNNVLAIQSGTNAALCRGLGCYVGTVVHPPPIPDSDVCVPSVPNGWVTELSNSPTTACESGCFTEYDADDVLCKSCASGSECTSGIQRTIASLLQNMGVMTDNCKMAFYVVAFGGGFIMMMFMMMAL